MRRKPQKAGMIADREGGYSHNPDRSGRKAPPTIFWMRVGQKVRRDNKKESNAESRVFTVTISFCLHGLFQYSEELALSAG